MAHEFVHSWNGKYRRPMGLATGNYDKPMIGELLWVYEGLTTYLGDLLPVRAGILTPEEFADFMRRDREKAGVLVKQFNIPKQ